jgi:hypothetical protein
MPAIQGRPTATVSESLMHVAFVIQGGDLNGKIFDYYYDDEAGWLVQDVTDRVPGVPSADGTVATLPTDRKWHALLRSTSNGLSHVYYRDGEGWFYDDLAGVTHASAIAGTAACTTTPDQLHVFYRDSNQHIAHTYHRDGGWLWEDMSQAVPGSPLNAAGDPAVIYAYGQLHVAYLGDDNSLAHFYYQNGQGWQRQDMTTPGGRAPSPLGAPVFLAYDNRLECFYRDKNGHIARLYFARGAWQYEDISALSNTTSVAAGDPAAVSFDHPRIVFRDTNGHIIQLSGARDGGKWAWMDLTQASSARAAVSGPALANYANQLHVFFAADDGRIHDIYGLESFKAQDLDTLARRPAPIGKLSLHNSGAYLVTMRINYLMPSGRQRQSPATTSLPFEVGQTVTVDPGKFGVAEGDELWIEMSAYLGNSAQGHQHFIYRSGNPGTARYTCSGTTLDVKLHFDGIREGSAVAEANEAATPA